MQVCNDTFHTISFNIGRLCGFYSHSWIGFEHKHKEVLSLCLTEVVRECLCIFSHYSLLRRKGFSFIYSVIYKNMQQKIRDSKAYQHAKNSLLLCSKFRHNCDKNFTNTCGTMHIAIDHYVVDRVLTKSYNRTSSLR